MICKVIIIDQGARPVLLLFKFQYIRMDFDPYKVPH